MKFIQTVVLIYLLLASTTSLYAADDLLDAGRAVTIDVVLENAIRRGLIAGGVVVVGNRHAQLYGTTQGRLYPELSALPLTDTTLFDIASLTKVIATAPAIMMLLEQNKINLLDPITRWFPEFEDSDRDDITILNLLTHTSGMDDVDIATEAPLKSLIEKSIIQSGSQSPGNRFRYADINFILLGELVKRVSGTTLDQFTVEQIFAPLGMAHTGFLPQTDFTVIAPTAGQNKQLKAGVVQDINARKFGGIAGHAGLFSTASDLSRFATMLLNKGKAHQARIFSERAIAQMTSPYFYQNGKVIRGLGWDIHSPFSSPRGSYFSDMSFGHTGYSGSSIWIDQELDLYVILLTIRLDYANIKQFNQLRSDISSLAVSIFATPRFTSEISAPVKIP